MSDAVKVRQIFKMDTDENMNPNGWKFFSRFFIGGRVFLSFLKKGTRLSWVQCLTIICIYIHVTLNAYSQQNNHTDHFTKEIPYTGFFRVGEELTYEVSYLMLSLGTIKSKVVEIDRTSGKPHFKVETHIKSYKGIPFTTINTVFQSTINGAMNSISFGTKEWYKDTIYKYINYTFDEKKDVVYVSERIGNQKIMQNFDTLKMDGKKYQDGCSLLFYARGHLFAHNEVHVPTLIYRTKADTYIHFGREHISVDIDAVDYPVDVIKFDGEAGFTGIFGLTGGFKGYFSADSACVPITAQMKVYIGNVNIELIRWKRPGWKPPKYVEK